ncbi:MAG: hypothetical protein HN584_04965, partial [Akkermansiaceae bacterium]|nr:hypothetical protein [Akkermansiaceae bacterium]
MNPEEPRDIKCPQCEHRIPLDVDADKAKGVICPQCKTEIQNIEDSIVPSSSPVSELPDKQGTDLGITLDDLIKDNATEDNITGVTANSGQSEVPAQEKKGLN